MFGSFRQHVTFRPKFGQLRQKFGVIYGIHLQRFALAADINLKLLYLGYY